MTKITIRIDDVTCHSSEPDTIYNIATKHGITIPTMCLGDKISHTTSCFICIVKDKKTGRYLPSCSYRAMDGMNIDASSDEVKNLRQTALDLLLSEHQGDCEAPCTIACPAHALVEEYVRAGKENNLLEALKILKQRIPLPLSVGRVCPRFCEKDCRRKVVDKEPVAINDFKRLAADLHYETYMEELPPIGKHKVAIVGAGPAGLSIAYFLRLWGIASDIYERQSQAGGMLRYGIPQFRLPKEILDREVAHFTKMGDIRIHYNKSLGKDFSLEKLKQEFDAVAITIGSQLPSPMRAEGEEHALGGIVWLDEIAKRGWQGENPGKTVVIGGGNTAMDCVRTAIRLGSQEVICSYRRTEKEMPAEQLEIDEAKEEGVKFNFLEAPSRLRIEGDKKILTLIKMELGEPDASGRRRPVPIPGSEYELEADTVIAAIGQKTDAGGVEGLNTNRWGDVDVASASNLMADNVFAAGDCVSGPATVVEAIAHARRAALGIKAYLEGKSHQDPYIINVSRGSWQYLDKSGLVFLNEPVTTGRIKQRHIPIEKRMSTFEEISFTFSKDEVASEGKRCLECSCTSKSACKLKDYSEEYGARTDRFNAEKLPPDYDSRHKDILLDRGKCIKCGICIKTCKEVVNKSLLGFKFRGHQTIVGTALNQVLEAECSDCGECVKNCPVGALIWKNKQREQV